MSENNISWFILLEPMGLEIIMCDKCLKIYKDFMEDRDQTKTESIMCIHKYKELKEKMNKKKTQKNAPKKA